MTEALAGVPYTPRRVRPLGLLRIDDWRVKLHGLSATPGGELDDAAHEGARKAAEEALPRPGTGGGRYGVGFVIAHRTPDAYSYVVGWWAYGCLLSTAAYSARFSEPAEIARSPARQAGCVWELAVVDHERRAWTRTMLNSKTEGDVEGYLRAVLSGKV